LRSALERVLVERARAVRVLLREEVRVVAFASWVRFWMKSCAAFISHGFLLVRR
jgi:hypothetical protein